MAETHVTVVPKIAKIPGYQKQFQLIFGGGASLQHIAEAIAAFERTIVSQNSAFDKYVMGENNAMDEGAVRGMGLFRGKARCILCHNGPNFTDNQFHNLGVPQEGPLKEDLGRFNVTRLERDKGAFKTPTLRSISETAPYMHDGVFKTLVEVVDFLDKGGNANPHLSPLMKPLSLTADERVISSYFSMPLREHLSRLFLPSYRSEQEWNYAGGTRSFFLVTVSHRPYAGADPASFALNAHPHQFLSRHG